MLLFYPMKTFSYPFYLSSLDFYSDVKNQKINEGS